MSTAVSERLGPGFVAVADGAHSAGRVVPPAIVEQGCEIGEGAHVGSLVVLGRDVTVGAHSRIERCVVLDGARIGAGLRAHGLHRRAGRDASATAP